MKKTFILLFFLIISFSNLISQNLDSINLYAGWDTSNPLFKLQKIKINQTDYSKILETSDRLFTADSKNNFRIWDLTSGKLLYWKKIDYQLPILLINDSLVAFRGYEKRETNDFNYIYLLNLKTNTIISQTKDSVQNNIIYIDFSILSDKILFVTLGGIYPPNSNFATYKYQIPTLIRDTISKYSEKSAKYIFAKDTNTYLSEIITHSFDAHSGIWVGEDVINLFKNSKIYSYLLTYNLSFDSDYSIHKMSKQFNVNENKCFYFFDNILYVFVPDSFANPTIRTMNQSITSYITDSSDNLIYYDFFKDQIVKYKYSDSTFYSVKLDLSLGKSSILTNSKLNDYILVPEDGGIVQLNKSKLFNVKPKIITDRTSIIVNQDINFQIGSFDPTLSVIWDFGDGKTSNEVNPAHIYLDSGSFTVKLITSNGQKSDTVIAKDLIKVEKEFYPVIKADNYYGIAPLNVKLENKTIDFPETINPKWYVDGIFSGVTSNSFTSQFNYGEHKIDMEFEYNGKTYKESVMIMVYDAFYQQMRLISSYNFSGSVGADYVLTNNLLDFVNLGYDRFVSLIETFSHRKWENKTTYKAVFHNKRIDNNSEISDNINKETFFASFPKYGYLVGNGNLISVFDKNNLKLFQRKVNESGQNLVLLNKEKYLGFYDNSKLSVFGCDMELVKQINFRELIGNTGIIKKATVLGNESYDYDSFYLILQLESGIWVGKFNLECEFIQSITLSGNLIKPFRNQENLFIYYEINGTRYLHIFNNSLKDIKTISLADFLFDEICANDSFIATITEQKDSSNGKIIIHDTEFNKLDSFRLKFYGWSVSYSPYRFLFMEDKSLLLINIAQSDYTNVTKNEYFQIILKPLKKDSIPGIIPISSNTPYPNPSINFLKIETEQLDNTNFIIYNEMGTEIEVKYVKNKKEKNDLYQIYITSLPIGTYYYRISNIQKTITGRFVVVR